MLRGVHDGCECARVCTCVVVVCVWILVEVGGGSGGGGEGGGRLPTDLATVQSDILDKPRRET